LLFKPNKDGQLQGEAIFKKLKTLLLFSWLSPQPAASVKAISRQEAPKLQATNHIRKSCIIAKSATHNSITNMTHLH
jgi:hypothetical protein